MFPKRLQQLFKKYAKFFVDCIVKPANCTLTYGSILTHPWIKLLVVLWYVIYISIASFGLTFIKEGLEPQNLLPSDSYAISYYYQMQDIFWPVGPEVQLVVNSPPNFTRAESINETYGIVDKFLDTKYTMSESGLNFFMDDFLFFLKTSNSLSFVFNRRNRYEFAWRLKSSFLKLGPYARWRGDVKFGDPEKGEGEYEIKAFRFSVGLRNFKHQIDQMRACFYLRQLADSIPEYNISTLWPNWSYMDQYAMVVPNSLQNIIIALGCMMVVSVIFIPHLACALCVAFSIVSISYGVIGVMSLWAVDFDVIAMITMTMSVGFSVDFAAHISHGYVTSKQVMTSMLLQLSL